MQYKIIFIINGGYEFGIWSNSSNMDEGKLIDELQLDVDQNTQ
jgi:hypothetical protein